MSFSYGFRYGSLSRRVFISGTSTSEGSMLDHLPPIVSIATTCVRLTKSRHGPASRRNRVSTAWQPRTWRKEKKKGEDVTHLRNYGCNSGELGDFNSRARHADLRRSLTPSCLFHSRCGAQNWREARDCNCKWRGMTKCQRLILPRWDLISPEVSISRFTSFEERERERKRRRGVRGVLE